MKANIGREFRMLMAVIPVYALVGLAQNVRGNPEPPDGCAEGGPHWSITTFPLITAYVPSIPEPGLTNETITIVGYVEASSGSLTGTYDCSGRQDTASWPMDLKFFPWTATLIPSQTGVASSFAHIGTLGPPFSVDASISFASPYAGDELVSVSMLGTNSFKSGATTNYYQYFLPFYPVYVPISILPRQRLTYLSFNNVSLEGNLGQLPAVANNISRVLSPFGPGINFDSPSSIELKYPAFQNDVFSVLEGDASTIYSTGSPNVRFNEGTVRFWFSPNWSSGSGPNNGVVFQFLGSGGSPLRTVQIASSGSTIQIGSVSFPLHLTAGQWYQVVATYSPGASSVYTNGVQAGSTGAGIGGSAANILAGFRVGSDGGSGQVRGIMDEVETFNYPKPSSEILSDYQAACAIDADGDGISDLTEFQMGIDPSDPPGGIIPTAPPSTNPGDTTPPVIHLLQPINAIPY